MLKLIPRYKQGNKSPDHDPNNPYHYHNAKGEKIVITPEDWEANVGKPYFKEIEDAVRAEQAAYPEPEYEVNPDFVRDLRSTYRSNMGNGYQNYRNFSSSLPQGYTFTSEGMIVDPQGNYYVQSGYRQSPRFIYSTDNPLRFTIHKGRPIERNLTFYPVNMDKKIKAPLPVDRTLDVKAEYQAAVDNYIQNNINNRYGIGWYNHTSDSFKDKATYGTLGIFSLKNPDEYGWESGTEHYYPMSEGQRNKLNDAFNRVVDRQDKLGTYSKEDMLSILKAGGLEDLIDDFIATSTKPSRQEAEKKAIISIGPLEKVNTFATGGTVDGPDEPPESEDNKIYQSIWNISKEENPNGQKERLEIIAANNYVKPYTAVLRTYPYFHKNYVISHSALRAYRDGFDHQMNPVSVSKYFDDSNYNLFNNNCSDATGEALNLDTKGLTTPKYIREQVLKKHPDAKEHTRKDSVIFTKFPISKAEYDRIKAEQIKQTRINNGEVSENYSIEDALHDNTFAIGGHLYQDGGKLKLIPRALRGIPLSVILQPAVADNTRYVRPYTSIEIAKSKKAYEQEQLQKLIGAAQERLPQLKADTRSTEQRQRDHNRAIQLEVKQKANELAANFGRALGANHDMTVDEVNQNTLNTANLMGYMAAPYLMTTLESGYYLGTGRSKEAAITAGIGYGLPALNKPLANVSNTTKAIAVSNRLKKGIKNTKLETPVQTSKNPANSRYKLGDAEMDDPNLMYHVDNGDFTGFSGNGAYVKDGLLFPTQNESGQTPYTWWNLGRPYRNNQSRLLTVVKDNPNLLKVRDQNYPIGQWTGNPTEKSFVTNSEYISSEPVKIGNQYIYEPGYGYRRVNNIPTLKEVNAIEYTSEPTEEELRSVFSDIRKQEELNAVASGSTNSDKNLYFKQGVDYTVRPLLKETQEVIDLQIAPRLFGLRLSLMKLPVNDGYYRGSIDLVKKNTRVSEWNPEMIAEYNRLNNESVGGWSLPDKSYIVVGKSDFRPMAQTEVHEARHQIQKSIKPTLEESKILKQAYSDVPRPFNPDGSVKPGYENYDMSVEYETMNAEARKVLLDKAGYKYDPNLSSEQNLEIQNKLLDNYSEKDIASILVDSRTGYWTSYIEQLTKNHDGPLESWVKTDEGKKKIHDWLKAMKYVGANTGIIGTASLLNKHNKGGKLMPRQ